MRSITAVIVTWNSADTIDRCIESCSGLAITVVDNASSDDTAARARRHGGVTVIANRENRGFAAAVNQGVANADSDCVLLLNPDVELLTPVDALAEACGNHGVVIAAGRLVNAAGATQTGFTVRRLPTALTLAFEALGVNRLFPWNPVNRRYRYRDLFLNTPASVEQPAGAFMLFETRLWREMGGFDERFFPIWFEDVDFCKRALERGSIQYLPAVTARHRGGASIELLDWECRELYWYASLLKYASKHFSPLTFRGLCGAVVLGSAVRMLAALFVRRTLKAITVYAKTAGFAARCVVSGRIPGPDHSEAVQATRVRTITSSTE